MWFSPRKLYDTDTGTFPTSSRSTRRRQAKHKHICQNRMCEQIVCLPTGFPFFPKTSVNVGMATTEAWCSWKCWLMSFQLTRTSSHVYVVYLIPFSIRTTISCAACRRRRWKKKFNDFLIGFCSQMDLSCADSLSFLASLPPATGDPINYIYCHRFDKNIPGILYSLIHMSVAIHIRMGNICSRIVRRKTMENQFRREIKYLWRLAPTHLNLNRKWEGEIESRFKLCELNYFICLQKPQTNRKQIN